MKKATIEDQSLKGQIKYAQKWYKSLYGCKDKILSLKKIYSHIFLDYGTGFTWLKNGKLFDAYHKTDKEMMEYRKQVWEDTKEDRERLIKQGEERIDEYKDIIKISSPDDPYIEKMKKIIKREKAYLKESRIFNPYGEYIQSDHSRQFQFSIISDHSPVSNIPKNVDPEYKKGIIKVLNWVIEENNPKEVKKAKKILETLQS